MFTSQRSSVLVDTYASLSKIALPAAAAVAALAVGCMAPAPSDRSESTGAGSAPLTQNAVTRESFDNQGRQGNAQSTTPSISPNGRYVAFQSESNVWAPAVDTNGTTDVYVKDRWVGSVTLVSAANGTVGNGASLNASVADDGSVAFVTNATNLSPAATGPFAKVLVRTHAGALVRADRALAGEADGPSSNPQISGDGSAVVFQSSATNLVAGDTNGVTDVFVASGLATTPALTRASLTESGAQTNGASYYGTIDYAGDVVAFASDASNILFNDGNDATDVFAAKLSSALVAPVSFATTGFGGAVGDRASSLPQISGDGRTVVFRSFATNFGTSFNGSDSNGLGAIYVNGIQSGHAPVPVSLSTSGAFANGTSYQSAVSYDGSVVAFVSIATNLGPIPKPAVPEGPAGVFVHSEATGQTLQVDVGIPGIPSVGAALINSSLQFSGSPSVPSPSFLVFDSSAANLVYGDTNGSADVFSTSLSL
jgi:Tol biopolymer transport system component